VFLGLSFVLQVFSTASRIDYFLISTDIKSRIVSADIRPATISYTDHQAISLKINHKAESRGRGYFKLNSKILENEEYKEIIKQLISKYQKKLVIQKTDIFLIFENFTIKLKISPTSAISFMINF
jgi:hypothetical protein